MLGHYAEALQTLGMWAEADKLRQNAAAQRAKVNFPTTGWGIEFSRARLALGLP